MINWKLVLNKLIKMLLSLAHDIELDRIGLIASGAAASVAAEILALWLTSIIDPIIIGDGGNNN
jgi:hypothetical protein